MSREQRLKNSRRQAEAAFLDVMDNLCDPEFVEAMNTKLEELHTAANRLEVERDEAAESWSNPNGFILYAGD